MRRILVVFVFLLMGLLFSGTRKVYAQEPLHNEPILITPEFAQRSAPSVFGEHVVWAEYGTPSALYVYDLQKDEAYVHYDAQPVYAPTIHGTRIVYFVYGEDDEAELWLTDILDTNSQYITLAESGSAALSDKYIVWHYDNDLNMQVEGYNLETQETFLISAYGVDAREPDIDGSFVVWQEYDDVHANWDIKLKNVATDETWTIAESVEDETDPQISGGRIFWFEPGEPIVPPNPSDRDMSIKFRTFNKSNGKLGEEESISIAKSSKSDLDVSGMLVSWSNKASLTDPGSTKSYHIGKMQAVDPRGGERWNIGDNPSTWVDTVVHQEIETLNGASRIWAYIDRLEPFMDLPVRLPYDTANQTSFQRGLLARTNSIYDHNYPYQEIPELASTKDLYTLSFLGPDWRVLDRHCEAGVSAAYFCYDAHEGWDFSCSVNSRKRTGKCDTPEHIYPVASGIVKDKGYQPGGYGYFVIVDHDNGYRTLYGHMASSSTIPISNTVNTSTILGEIGSTGWSTGPHLHLGFQYRNGTNVDPAGWRDYLIEDPEWRRSYLSEDPEWRRTGAGSVMLWNYRIPVPKLWKGQRTTSNQYFEELVGVDIPAYTIPGEGEFRLDYLPIPVSEPREDLLALGVSVVLRLRDELGLQASSATDLNGPYTLRMLYYEDEIFGEADEDTIAIYRFDDGIGEWEKLDTELDTAANHATAYPAAFGLFALLADAPDTSNNMPKVSFSQSAIAPREGNSTVEVDIVLDKPSGNQTYVRVTAENGTAIAGEDFEEISNHMVLFNPGETLQILPIMLIDDSEHEGNESFILRLHDNYALRMGEPNTMVIMVQDDDENTAGSIRLLLPFIAR